MNQNTSIAVAPEGAISSIPLRGTAPPIIGEPQQSRYFLLWRLLTFGLRVRWKRALLLWLRFAANPLLTIRWWRFIAAFTAARGFPPPHDELLQKPLSKFLVFGMGSSKRLTLLMDHFWIAERILSRESMISLWRGEWLEMGTVPGRSETYACFIALADRSGGRHEGAFAIKLLRLRDQAVLCTARFMFLREGTEGRYTFVVGSMQGPRNAKQQIVEVTRDLSGLRPKEAMLIVLQGLTIEGGAPHFLAVSQDRHPIHYRRGSRRSMMVSNVDAFWAERSGQPEGTYGFTVPHSKIYGADKRSRSKLWFYNIGELFH
ncbi:virK protein [Rhizobium sp. AC27/96]|uniref:DUF535 family protein n=1 Tax=Rhizobium sp. AC27/96 TaxID=1841653 RepID=UPI0008285B58|nr:DUF535 family protein [Rhizobium sp. AC27/96]OCJ00426.1 virK protein [Rhizobium sp. AC27/96]